MKKRFFYLLLLVLLVASILMGKPSVQAASEEPIEVIIYVKDTVPVQGLLRAAAAINSDAVIRSIPSEEVVDVHRFSSFDGFSAKVSKAEYARLKKNPSLEVYENIYAYLTLDDSAPLVNATLTPRLIYNGTNLTGSGISVCVLDSGINYSHSALGGCTEASFLAGTCAKVPGGFDYVNSDDNPYDDNGHGSHVAGIVASTDDTYRGIAPNASIIALKVCNNAGSCNSNHIISGIDWCINNASKFNISVISMSLSTSALFSTYCDDDATGGIFRRPIDDAVAKNISVIASTGNAGSTTQIGSPACVKNATAVGSTTETDGFSSFNRNNITDLLAPGSFIKSVEYDGTFEVLSGTSMAAPHVAGAFALLAQFNKLTKNINISPNEAFLALNTTGVNLTDTGGSEIQFARISIYNAILHLDSDAPNLTIVDPTLANNSNSTATDVFVNITSSEILQNASLEWDNVTDVINYSMNGSGLNWFRNHSASSQGVITYRVWGNDSAGNWGHTETRTVQVNNTAPSIDTFSPANLHHNITEPNNQTFNITYTDAENGNVVVDWYVNGTLQSSAQNTNFTFLGNFSQATQQKNGTYNITVILSDGGLTTQLNWTLTVNNTNRAPVWASISNQTIEEDTTLSFTIAAEDLDNDSITYFLNNTINFTINSTNGTINFNSSNAANFSGTFYLAVPQPEM